MTLIIFIPINLNICSSYLSLQFFLYFKVFNEAASTHTQFKVDLRAKDFLCAAITAFVLAKDHTSIRYSYDTLRVFSAHT